MRPNIKAAIDRYVETGCQLGGFLTAVMENNLMEAMGHADEENIRALHSICEYVYMEVPSICHGSPQKVQEWYAMHAAKRAEAASSEPKEQQS